MYLTKTQDRPTLSSEVDFTSFLRVFRGRCPAQKASSMLVERQQQGWKGKNINHWSTDRAHKDDSVESEVGSNKSETPFQDFSIQTRVRSKCPIHSMPHCLFDTPPRSFESIFGSGRTSAFQFGPYASYYLYIPTSHPVSRRATGEDVAYDSGCRHPLLVLVHGTRRDAESLRDRWVEFAEKKGCVVLCPLFPANITVSILDYDGHALGNIN